MVPPETLRSTWCCWPSPTSFAIIPIHSFAERPLPALCSKPVAANEIDVGDCTVTMLRCQPVKVLHALSDPHYNWYLVTPRETFEREKRPPGAKRDARPTVRIPAEQENIRCIEAHNAVQIPGTHDNDAQAHRPRTFPRKGSRLGGKREHHRAVGQLVGNELLDHR